MPARAAEAVSRSLTSLDFTSNSVEFYIQDEMSDRTDFRLDASYSSVDELVSYLNATLSQNVNSTIVAEAADGKRFKFVSKTKGLQGTICIYDGGLFFNGSQYQGVNVGKSFYIGLPEDKGFTMYFELNYPGMQAFLEDFNFLLEIMEAGVRAEIADTDPNAFKLTTSATGASSFISISGLDESNMFATLIAYGIDEEGPVLQGLTLDNVMMNEPFDPKNTHYTAHVSNDIQSVKVRPLLQSISGLAPTADAPTIKVNNQIIADGEESGSIDLVPGHTRIEVVVTNPNITSVPANNEPVQNDSWTAPDFNVGETGTLSLTGLFTDPDEDDQLTYEVESLSPDIAEISDVTSDQATVKGLASGTAELQVTVHDGHSNGTKTVSIFIKVKPVDVKSAFISEGVWGTFGDYDNSVDSIMVQSEKTMRRQDGTTMGNTVYDPL